MINLRVKCFELILASAKETLFIIPVQNFPSYWFEI